LFSLIGVVLELSAKSKESIQQEILHLKGLIWLLCDQFTVG